MGRAAVFSLLLVTSSLGLSCESGAAPAPTVTQAELFADPASYEGRRIRLLGAPTVRLDGCSTATCASLPCNGCGYGFEYVSEDGTVHMTFRSAGGFVPEVVARPATPAPGLPDLSTTVGCVGHELEQVCAPAIPEAIVAVTGTPAFIVHAGSAYWVFTFDSFEISRGQAATADCYGAVAPSCSRHSATTPYRPDGG